MPSLPSPTDGRIALPPGDVRLRQTLVVRDDLRIEGAAAGSRLLWSGVGPLILHRSGRLHLTGVELVRDGGYDGLVHSVARLVLDDVALVGARPWHTLPEPRPAFEAAGARCDAAVLVAGGGHLSASRCGWRANAAPVVHVQGRARGTVTGGRFEGGPQPGFRVSERARLSLQRVRLTGLEGPVIGHGPGTRLRLGRCTGSAPGGTVVQAHGEQAVLKNCTLREAHTGLRVTLGSLRMEGCAVRDHRGTGVEVAGHAEAELVNCTMVGNAWAGASVGGSARLRVRGGRAEGNTHGLLADAEARLALDGVEVHDNARLGVSACDDARVEERGVEVGAHPDGARTAWHRVEWTGASVSVAAQPPASRLRWVADRLRSRSETPVSRGRLLGSLGPYLADTQDGPWLVPRLLGGRA
jgi:hypothetical protein